MAVSALEQLVAVGSGPLNTEQPDAGVASWRQLTSLLSACDGFYAFESALHVLPSAPTPSERSVSEWNAAGLWRHAFPALGAEWCFFAEDTFGGQVALGNGGVSLFDPETGEFERVANDLQGWARAVLDNYRVLTGFPLAHEWQIANGALLPGQRLTPKIPFVLGGEFAVENLYAADSVSALLYRAELAGQTRDLADGTPVTFRIVE
jgi:hypothetical protein